MNINLSPIRADWPTPTLSVSGTVLTIDGDPVDLSKYDAEVSPHLLIVGQPVKVDGIWDVTVLLPHCVTATEAVRFPDSVSVTSGQVTLPT